MRLGNYEVLGPIGKGGFGRVWLARAPRQLADGSDLVAIKRMRHPRGKRRGRIDDVTRFEEAFRNEAAILSYLQHPNIVHVVEMTTVDKDVLLVMEFINGIGLDELLIQRRYKGLALPPDVALEIAIQAGRGLSCAHLAQSPAGESLKIVHRDVKPSNIMLNRAGRVLVMDFGVARSILPRIATTTGTIKGTLRYLAPEQAQGIKDIGPAADQYALGLVLGEMVIGRPFYDAEKDHQILYKALRGEVAEGLYRTELISPPLAQILTRAVAFRPEDRYPAMHSFVSDLEQVDLQIQSEFSVAEWVHLGLEERARQAADDPDGFWVHDPSAISDVTPDNEEATPHMMGEFPVGWAHDRLAIIDATDDSGADDSGVRSSLDHSAPPIRVDIDHPSGFDDTDPELLQFAIQGRGQHQDASNAMSTVKTTRKAILERKNSEFDALPPPAPAPADWPTAYAVKRPGSDKVGERTREVMARIQRASVDDDDAIAFNSGTSQVFRRFSNPHSTLSTTIDTPRSPGAIHDGDAARPVNSPGAVNANFPPVLILPFATESPPRPMGEINYGLKPMDSERLPITSELRAMSRFKRIIKRWIRHDQINGRPT